MTTPNPQTQAELLTLVEIPAGTFLMGSPEDEEDHYDDEGPQHKVTLERFFMSQTPITQAQWRQVALWQPASGEPPWERELNPDPSFFKSDLSENDRRPVESVSWFDAQEFCHRLSQRTGRHYTLPSEAQWEYACRAGTTTPYAFGDSLSQQQANFDTSATTAVGSFPANAWGLHDMHGNVWEWCADHWHDSYRGAPDDGSAWVEDKSLGKSCAAAPGSSVPGTAARPTAAASSPTMPASTSVSVWSASPEFRLLRGGSWVGRPGYCRSACRLHGLPGEADGCVGFRVVCLPQPCKACGGTGKAPVPSDETTTTED
jgi:formylglycine-generating enzyme required for sulfatase activity